MPIYTTYLGFLKKIKFNPVKVLPNELKSVEFCYIMRNRGNRAVEPPEMVLRLAKEKAIIWQGYRDAYLDSLDNEDSAMWMQMVAERSFRKNIVLVCMEGPRFGKKCHRFLLAERMVELYRCEYRGELSEPYTKRISDLNEQIDKLPMCEERDDLIKQKEALKWVQDSRGRSTV